VIALRTLLFCALVLHSLAAQDLPNRPLTVATKVAPPFVSHSDAGWTGLSIELWRLVAAKMGVQSELVERDLATMLKDTADGKVDLAIAALTVTAEREAVIDFSHPFLSSGLGIATRQQEQGVVGAVIERLFSASLLNALLALALVLTICGVLVWLFERRVNAEQFGGKGLSGLGSGLWFSAVTMTTVGFGDKAPKTIGGRAVALVWMFASVIVISSYTAAIASALTVESMTGVVRGPEDLPGARVGTVSSSAAAEWLTGRRLDFRGYTALQPAMDDLESGQLDAVVYDSPILHSLTTDGGEIRVLPHTLRQDNYAFAMPHGSPLRKPLNRALLEVLESSAWTSLRERYLGK
tara:strand:+ start:25863 stop:26918 length:1056 start_codon:yes stop_codon:yes gene_type:complete